MLHKCWLNQTSFLWVVSIFNTVICKYVQLCTAGAHFIYMSVEKFENRSKMGRINWISNFLIRPISIVNRILDFLIPPNSFSQLTSDPKIIAIWDIFWTINIMDGQWPWRRHFRNRYPLVWTSLDLHRGLPLHLLRPSAISHIWVGRGYHCIFLSLNVFSFLICWVRRWW